MLEEIEEVRKELTKLSKQSHHLEVERIQPQLLEVLTNPQWCTSLLDPLLKIIPSNDGRVKEIIYDALTKVCPWVPDSELLLVNQVKKDCDDPNPSVRSIAVTTISWLCTLASMLLPSLQKAFKDSSPYVRRAGVLACRNIHNHSPQVLIEGDFFNKLYAAVGDSDPIVVVHSLTTLDKILADEGGVVITKSMCIHLMKRLNDFPAVHLAKLFDVMHRFKPPTEQDEVMSLLNYLNIYVMGPDRLLTLSSVRLGAHLTQNLPKVKQHFYELGINLLVNQVDGASLPWLCQLIDFLTSSDEKWIASFIFKSESFYPKKTDDVHVIEKKMGFLPFLCTPDNNRNIIEQVSISCGNTLVLSCGITCLCCIAQRHPFALGFSVEKLLQHLRVVPEKEMEQILLGLQKLDLHLIDEIHMSQMIEEVVASFHNRLDNPSISPILPWLVGEFGHLLKTSLNIMQTFISNFSNYDYVTREVILTASFKLFFHSPAEYQESLGVLLEQAIEDESLFLSRRASLYYNLLEKDPKLLKDIFMPREASTETTV